MSCWDRLFGNASSGQNIYDEKPSGPIIEHSNQAHAQQSQSTQTFSSNSFANNDCGNLSSNDSAVCAPNDSMASSVSSPSVTFVPPLTSAASTYETMPLLAPTAPLRDITQLETYKRSPLFEELDKDEAQAIKIWRAHRLEVKEGKKPQKPTVGAIVMCLGDGTDI
jgi:hypothetical protein